MRRCGTCEELKSLDAFHRRGTSGLQSVCKECRRADDKERYSSDPEHHYRLREIRRRELSEWALELKQGKPCTDCEQQFHPAAMQWDHTGSDKQSDVADMAWRGYSKARILREIAKCELVCANCHAVRTYERRKISASGL